MKSEGVWKHVMAAFCIALAFYFIGFNLLEYRRTSKGPWEVVFLTDNDGHPAILISQPKLNIRNKKIVFADQRLPRKNLVAPVHFDSVTGTGPFGEVVFRDLTFLPGTVTFNFFNHEVELLPRTLVVDKQQYKWNLASPLVVTGPGKFERLPPKPMRRR